MSGVEIVEPNKQIIELIKTILEQNRVILLTNKMLLEYISAPPICISKSD